MKGSGGSEGGLGLFFFGLIMAVGGVYLFFDLGDFFENLVQKSSTDYRSLLKDTFSLPFQSIEPS